VEVVDDSLEVELELDKEDDVEYVSELEIEEDNVEEVVEEFENALENVAADKLLELEITRVLLAPIPPNTSIPPELTSC